MSDQPSNGQLRGGPEGVVEEPPQKRPCLNNVPPTAVPDVAITPVDDGSDFYNTPVTAGTPVNNAVNGSSSTENNEPSTPPKAAPLIPGLSLFNDSLQASQPENGSISSPQKTDDRGAATGPGPETSTEPTHDERSNDTQAVASVPEPKDTEMQEPPPVVESTTETQKTTGQDDSTAEHAKNALDGDAQDSGKEVLQRPDGDVQDSGKEMLQRPDAANSAAAEEEEEEGEDEHPEWETDSSPIMSSSDDSSTDSSDDSDEDEDYPILSAEETARILMQAEAGSDDEGEGKGKAGAAQVRTANEQPEEIPPIPDITVTPDMKIEFLGQVETIVENTVLVKANTSGEYQVLESGSLLCLEDRTVIGVVSETIGRVEQPFYAVRFQDPASIGDLGIVKEKSVFYVPSHSTFVFTQPLKGMKGSDASNFHDEEVGEDEIEFSDDEAEAEYKRKQKQKKQEKKDAKNEHAGLGKPKKEPPGPSKLGQTVLNYDDEGGEDGYTPLARPDNLHEMMGNKEAPVEGGEYSRGGYRGGRGRGGFDRGSGRGRGGGGGGRGRGGGGSWESRHHHQNSHDDRRQQHQDYNHDNTHTTPAYPPSSTQQQPQQPHPAQAPSYPQNPQQPFYGAPQQQYSAYPFYPQQQYAQLAAAAAQLPYQMPYLQAYQQQNPYANVPPGSHINPALFAALQQFQQQQLQQQQQAQAQAQAQPQQQQYQAAVPLQGQAQVQNQNQNPAATYDQVKAQLDILRQLSGGNQGQGQGQGGPGRT